MTTIITHDKDLDGFTSGAIIKMALEEKNADYQLIGYDYGQPFPWDKIPRKSTVIMADVSLPMEEMYDLAYYTDFKFTWIDHHKSDIEEFLASDADVIRAIPASLDSRFAACELCWKYFFPERPIPLAIELLGKYDTWRDNGTNYWDEVILPFQYGMRLYCTGPETFPMGVISDKAYVDEITKIGQAILKYQANVDAYAAKGAFEIDFKGYRAICMNGGGTNSQAFKTVYDEAKHDLMMPFRFNGKFWTFSIYTTKDIDCSVLAKELGGGGHAKSAGFQVHDLLKVINVEESKIGQLYSLLTATLDAIENDGGVDESIRGEIRYELNNR